MSNIAKSATKSRKNENSVNFINLFNDIEKMHRRECSLLNIKRKFKKYFKTSSFKNNDNYLKLTLRGTKNTVVITVIDSSDTYFVFNVISSVYPDYVLRLCCDSNRALIKKIVIKHDLFKITDFLKVVNS